MQKLLFSTVIPFSNDFNICKELLPFVDLNCYSIFDNSFINTQFIPFEKNQLNHTFCKSYSYQRYCVVNEYLCRIGSAKENESPNLLVDLNNGNIKHSIPKIKKNIHAVGLCSVNNKIFSVGGYSNGTLLDEINMFDLNVFLSSEDEKENEWNTIHKLHYKVHSSSVCQISNQTICIFGGYSKGEYSNSVY